MWVAKRIRRPSFTCAHLEWVPGMTMQDASRSAGCSCRAPTTWVSSPRITSGGRAPSSYSMPGTMQISAPGLASMPAASALALAGQAAYGTSRQPCWLPIMPQARTGKRGCAASQSPAMPSSAAAKAVAPDSVDAPLPLLRSASTLPPGPSRKARRLVLPQSRASRLAVLALLTIPLRCRQDGATADCSSQAHCGWLQSRAVRRPPRPGPAWAAA